MPVTIKTLTGTDLRAALKDLAQLRISVFRDWPYLYEGSLAYEQKYLSRYADTDGAVIIGAYDGDRLVGAATGEPMEAEVIQFRRPFEDRGYNIKQVFYLAESVLDPAYRGQGIGHRFFDEREAHARRLGYAYASFCAVVRPDDHPAKPSDYWPLDPFWRKRGYEMLDDAIVHFPWQDVGDAEETEKPMQVWFRLL
ncbi:ribosomal protein S18 acetylase RimI-like enzyme [Roseibium hamelinense]|uniref:Ribosomal protein S18 acetylase RimI-like enzyme n=1 Tax=Roseibium hamelinense TaxID=150831 RepID=A0A562T9W0_9HYPH|nr:GNAT family N-acetyltransferase [Roseibium hamelinense]MTI45550.1 N-acetyltransferase [Roseibium hamelinense]TWI90073.1 ribosomal protein S18 acetylase RimI-like enzyme [Roseibium hamelinense]